MGKFRKLARWPKSHDLAESKYPTATRPVLSPLFAQETGQHLLGLSWERYCSPTSFYICTGGVALKFEVAAPIYYPVRMFEGTILERAVQYFSQAS